MHDDSFPSSSWISKQRESAARSPICNAIAGRNARRVKYSVLTPPSTACFEAFGKSLVLSKAILKIL